MRLSLAVSVGLVCLAWFQGTPPAQTPASQTPQTPPTFRGRIDLVPLDVSVWDKDRQPVKGLKLSDFTLLEDDKLREIGAFAEFDIPEAPPPTATWMRDVRVDVESNDVTDKRLFLILVDDASFGDITMFPSQRDKIKDAARAVIRRLGPTDLAAVVFTGDNRRSQDFTLDHGRLLAAVNQMTGVKVPGGPGLRSLMSSTPTPLTALAEGYAVTVAERAVESLLRTPGRRKAVVDITYMDNAWPLSAHLSMRTEALFEKAQRAGVNVYTMGPFDPLVPDAWEDHWARRVAHETGGEWFPEVFYVPGAVEAAVKRIFQANSSYYVLGYSSADLEKFHTIKVLVNRPDVTVRTRDKYYWPEPEKPGPEPPPLAKAISEVLPNSGITMKTVAMPFANANGKGATIAVVTEVLLKALEGKKIETFDLRTNLFTSEGEPRGSVTTNGSVQHAGVEIPVELLSNITAPKPVLYSLRIAAHREAAALEGSVYTTVDVPDFAKLKLSMSGIVISTEEWPAFGPRDEMAKLLPAVPTTVREFEKEDEVKAYVRVYQGSGGKLSEIPVQIRIVDDHDKVVLNRTETLTPERFARGRSADVHLDLPTIRLVPGDYLLSFEATVEKVVAKRDVRFRIRTP